MPIQDVDYRKKVSRRWRENRGTPAYHRWLYARRKLRADVSEMFRVAMEQAVEVGDAAGLADALRAADEWERNVGNRFDHERQEPYYQSDDGIRLAAGGRDSE